MNNLQEEFLPYEESLKLKELGLSIENCFAWYKINIKSNMIHFISKGKYRDISPHQFDFNVCEALLFQQTFQWFRDKHNLHATFYPLNEGTSKEIHYEWLIHFLNEINYELSTDSNYATFKNMMSINNQYDDAGYFKTLREAELNVIRVMIKIIEGEN